MDMEACFDDLICCLDGQCVISLVQWHGLTPAATTCENWKHWKNYYNLEDKVTLDGVDSDTIHTVWVTCLLARMVHNEKIIGDIKAVERLSLVLLKNGTNRVSFDSIIVGLHFVHRLTTWKLYLIHWSPGSTCSPEPVDNATTLRGGKLLAFFTIESIGTFAPLCTTLYYRWIGAKRILLATVDNLTAFVIIFPMSIISYNFGTTCGPFSSKQNIASSLKSGPSSRCVHYMHKGQQHHMLTFPVRIKRGQWDPGGHFSVSKAVHSSQFKQWDPGKFVQGGNFYNLEDKVDFDGVGNVMILEVKRIMTQLVLEARMTHLILE